MDTDTLIILTMLSAAFWWWLKLQFLESKKLAEENKRKTQDQLLRAERIKRLLNRQ